MFILPDFPSGTARWLTPAEHALAEKRMEEDSRSHGHAGARSSSGFSDLLSLMADWRVWLVGTALGCCNASLSFNMFFPTLSATMGYTPTISLLLCTPPWVVSTITAVTVARYVLFLYTCENETYISQVTQMQRVNAFGIWSLHYRC